MGVLAESMAMETAVWIALVVSIVGIFAEIALGICLYVVSQRAKKVDTLEASLNDSADEKIEAKFMLSESRLLLPIEQLKAQVTEINRRLERGDGHFDDLGEREQKMQVTVLSRISELKDWMHENCASKDDLSKLSDRFDGLQRAVAKYEMARGGNGQ
jgi:hypothetical protein